MPNHVQSTSCAESSACGCGTLRCLSRPRFFAGQLLTEEDLNRLDHYIVEKQRLQNRYLHGWGIACGLEVSCDPCDPRLVKVSPGYALDPCGADIVVCGEDTVRVCDLIEACRRETRQPCQPHQAPSSCPEGEETWILAIRYQEQPTRGITALRRSGDYCDPSKVTGPPPREAPPQCEPTVLCEGHSYEVYGPVADQEQQAGSMPLEWLGNTPSTQFRADQRIQREALGERLSACNVPGLPDWPAPLHTNILYCVDTTETSRTVSLQNSVEGINPGYILCIEWSEDDTTGWDSFSVERVVSGEVTVSLGTRLDTRHRESDPVEVYDPQAIYRVCCDRVRILSRFLEKHPGTDCAFQARLDCLTCPDPGLEPATFMQTWDVVRAEQQRVLARIPRDCLCSALLAPCPQPTDQDRVPLATVIVAAGECRVLRVCNWTTERKLLTTFPNLQYWLSWLTREARRPQLRELLGVMCCDQARAEGRNANTLLQEQVLQPVAREFITLLAQLADLPSDRIVFPTKEG